MPGSENEQVVLHTTTHGGRGTLSQHAYKWLE